MRLSYHSLIKHTGVEETGEEEAPRGEVLGSGKRVLFVNNRHRRNLGSMEHNRIELALPKKHPDLFSFFFKVLGPI